MKFFLSAPVLALLAVPSLVAAQERITTQEFKAGLESGAYDMVLDVRSNAERANGFIPGTIHVPITGFEENPLFESLMNSSCKKECAVIVAHCSAGGRAEAAIESLIKLGFQGTLINGLGTDQWVDAGFALTTDEDDAVIEPICASTDICADSMGSMMENGDSMMSGSMMTGEDSNNMMSDMMNDGDSMMNDMGTTETMNGDSMMNDMGSMEDTETGQSESMASGGVGASSSRLDAFLGAAGVVLASMFANAF